MTERYKIKLNQNQNSTQKQFELSDHFDTTTTPQPLLFPLYLQYYGPH